VRTNNDYTFVGYAVVLLTAAFVEAAERVTARSIAANPDPNTRAVSVNEDGVMPDGYYTRTQIGETGIAPENMTHWDERAVYIADASLLPPPAASPGGYAPGETDVGMVNGVQLEGVRDRVGFRGMVMMGRRPKPTLVVTTLLQLDVIREALATVPLPHAPRTGIRRG
jgi:hypothetical protein